ncbi:MAG: hypothetical protein J7M10_02390 [Candidatus Cloacimonetes bacterium]|nr:hypothetical protein [Candidatus Cloacimonadota bacterium]
MHSQGHGTTGFTSYDLYLNYKKRFKGHDKKSEANVPYITYSTIIKDFNTSLSKAIMLHSFEFVMPYRLGKVRIRRIENKLRLNEKGEIDTTRLAPNWNECWKLWFRLYPGKTREEITKIRGKKMVYHLNKHTDGNSFTLFWSKIGNNIIHNRIYSLIFTYTNRRFLAQVIESEGPKTTFYE